MSYIKLVFVLIFINVTLAVKLAPTKKLNDGNKMPVIALGTVGAKSKARRAVEMAVKVGYRHIDTASSYHNEEYIGEGLLNLFSEKIVRREHLFITTKLSNSKHARESVVPALQKSLKKLGLDFVDLYLVQWPMAKSKNGSFLDIDYLETWKGMEDAKRIGLTRSIGVSNFNIEQIDRLVANSEIKPAVNQIEVNPTLTQEALVAHCQALDIAVTAYCPMGFLVPRGLENPPPPRVDDPELEEIADRYGKSTIQVVLRYLLDRGIGIVPRSVNKKHIIENVRILDYHLTDDEILTINSFNRNMRVVENKSSMNHPFYPFKEY